MQLLVLVMVIATGLVVIALFAIMWRERTSPRGAVTAALAGFVLAAWAIATGVLAASGFYLQSPGARPPPPVGIQLVVSLAVMAVCLRLSPTLRALLGDRQNLIRLNVWRLLGVVFLALMFAGQVPALWAVPAGAGDILIGAAAFWVAARLDQPGGRRRAVVFNLLGLLDLVVAIGLGITTTPGSAQIFHTTPAPDVLTRFPMALVPGFLVPLAFMVHFVSLGQLRRDR